MRETDWDSPSPFTKFRQAVIDSLVKSYAVTAEEADSFATMEHDTLLEIFEDGSVEEASCAIAVLQDLDDR